MARDDASVRELGTEFGKLVLAYAKQETVDPLKALGRYLLWGAAGAVAMSIGLFLISLAAVRLLQTELPTHLGGDLTWVPYLGGVLLAVIVAGLAVTRIAKAPK